MNTESILKLVCKHTGKRINICNEYLDEYISFAKDIERIVDLEYTRQLAAERLRADTMEQRWSAKTKECNELREVIAKLNEKLENVK